MTITAWAIKAPDGHIMFDSLNEDVPYLADCERDEGYRCVKVQITEMEEGK